MIRLRLWKIEDRLLDLIYSSVEQRLPKFNGDDSRSMPIPARLVVDRNSVVRAADTNLDHTVRPDPSTALEVLRGLRS